MKDMGAIRKLQGLLKASRAGSGTKLEGKLSQADVSAIHHVIRRVARSRAVDDGRS